MTLDEHRSGDRLVKELAWLDFRAISGQRSVLGESLPCAVGQVDRPAIEIDRDQPFVPEVADYIEDQPLGNGEKLGDPGDPGSAQRDRPGDEALQGRHPGFWADPDLQGYEPDGDGQFHRGGGHSRSHSTA